MPKYLERRRRRWYAVLDVPRDLRKHYGKKRLLKSLETESLSEAEIRKGSIIASWQADFEVLKTGSVRSSEFLLRQAVEWREDLAKAPDEERETLLSVLSDKAEDIAYRDPHLADAVQSVATGRSYPLHNGIDDWVSGLDVAPKTRDMQRSDATRFAERFSFSHDVSQATVQTWTLDLQTQDGLSNATIRRVISACRSYWDFLSRHGRIERSDDPFKNAVPTTRKTKAASKSKRVAFSAEEVLALVNAAIQKQDRRLAQLIWLAMWTGCRIEELCSLQVTDVQEQYFVVKDAKTNAGLRDVPMHPKCAVVVQALKQTTTDGYLLSGLTFNKYGDRSNAIGKRFGRLKNALGFGRQLVFHSIRRTVATELENAGIAEAVAADIVGHEKRTMTYGYYSGGHRLEIKLEAIKKLNYPVKDVPAYLIETT